MVVMEINVTGRKVTVTDALEDYAIEKIGNAMKVLSIDVPSAEVVLRVEKNRPVPCICEVTLRPKGHTIHVEEHEEDMYAAIDVAAAKVLRQLRKYKTRVVDRRHHEHAAPAPVVSQEDLAKLIEPAAEEEDDQLVREKFIDLVPMTEEEALVQTDLIGHDFYVFTNATTGLINVIYHRKNGGYGIIKPKIETEDEE